MEKKMKGNSSQFFRVSLLIVLVATAAYTVHALTCTEATTKLLPCLPYLTKSAPSPSDPCCEAVTDINAAANTTQSRKDLCNCLKLAIPAFGVDPARAKKLPGLCHVKVPVPIDPSIDCNHIP